MSKKPGGIGSNQYQTRGRPKISVPVLPPLIDDSEQRLVDFAVHVATALRKNAWKDTDGIIAMLEQPQCPAQAIRALVLPAPLKAEAKATTIAAAVRHPNCPDDVMRYARELAGDFSIKVALLAREGAEDEGWDNAARGRRPDDLIELARIPQCPDALKRFVWGRCSNGQDRVRCTARYLKRVAITPGISTLIDQIVAQPEPDWSQALAHNPTCPPDVLIELMTRGETIKETVLANPNCPDYIKAIAVLGQ